MKTVIVEKTNPYVYVPLKTLLFWLEQTKGFNPDKHYSFERLPEGVLIKQETKDG